MAMVDMETLVSPNLTSLDLWPHGPGVSHMVHVLVGIYVCVAGLSVTWVVGTRIVCLVSNMQPVMLDEDDSA